MGLLRVRDLVDLWSYIAWVWAVIASLIFILARLSREADRTYRMDLDRTIDGGAPTQDQPEQT